MRNKENDNDNFLDELFQEAYNNNEASELDPEDWSTLQGKMAKHLLLRKKNFRKKVIWVLVPLFLTCFNWFIVFDGFEQTPIHSIKKEKYPFASEDSKEPFDVNTLSSPQQQNLHLDSNAYLPEARIVSGNKSDSLNPQHLETGSAKHSKTLIIKETRDCTLKDSIFEFEKNTLPLSTDQKHVIKKPRIYILPPDTIFKFDTARVSKRKVRKMKSRN